MLGEATDRDLPYHSHGNSNHINSKAHHQPHPYHLTYHLPHYHRRGQTLHMVRRATWFHHLSPSPKQIPSPQRPYHAHYHMVSPLPPPPPQERDQSVRRLLQISRVQSGALLRREERHRGSPHRFQESLYHLLSTADQFKRPNNRRPPTYNIMHLVLIYALMVEVTTIATYPHLAREDLAICPNQYLRYLSDNKQHQVPYKQRPILLIATDLCPLSTL